MRLGDDGSDNFIDRTGRGGLGFGGGGGGNLLGCLIPLVASRFGMIGSWCCCSAIARCRALAAGGA